MQEPYKRMLDQLVEKGVVDLDVNIHLHVVPDPLAVQLIPSLQISEKKDEEATTEPSKPEDEPELEEEGVLEAKEKKYVKPTIYTKVPSDKLLKYIDHGDGRITINYSGKAFQTTWDELTTLSKMSDESIDTCLRNKGINNSVARMTHRKFAKLIADGVLQRNGKKMSSKEAMALWAQKPLIPIPNYPFIQYKECRGRIWISDGPDTIVYTNWESIVKWVSLSEKQLEDHLKENFPGHSSKQLVRSFIEAYCKGYVKDPDANYRKIVNNHTAADSDGSKLEMVIEP